MSQLHCSFCEKSETQVRKLVAGGGGGHICDECVAIAARIIHDSDSLTRGHSVWRRVRAALASALRPRGGTNLCIQD